MTGESGREGSLEPFQASQDVLGVDVSAVRAVVLDAVGTLIYADPPVEVVYSRVGRRFGSRKTCAEVAAAFRRAFCAVEEADLAGDLATSELREQQRWREIVATVLNDADDPEACFQTLYEHFAAPHAWRLYPDAATALPALLDAGWRVGIASNFDARLTGICRAHPFLSRCAPVAISSEVGFRKPHAAMFRAVEQRTRLRSKELLHVGDDLRNDYEGARDAGWHSAHLLRRGAVGTRAVPTIRSLDALLRPLGV